MTTATAITPQDLLGRQWTDPKGRIWEVKRLSNEEGKLRAIMQKSGRGKDLTVEEVLAEIANDEGNGATNAQPFAPYDQLIGKGWTTDTGEVWTITGSIIEDGEHVIVAVTDEGFEGHFDPTDIMETLNPKPAGEDQVVEAAAGSSPEIPDISLAGAGAEADEQYRQRQLDPSQRRREPRVLHLPQVVIDGVNAKLRELQGEIGRHGGKGKVALSITVKEGNQSGEYDLKYEVGMTPPKLKTSGFFWDGDELGDTGVPKRAPENQTTVFDGDAIATDDEPAAGASIEERIAADETADPGDVPDANPLPEGVPTDAEKAEAKRAAASQDDEVPADLVDDEEIQ